MQVAQPFASDRAAPAVLTIALHVVLILGLAAGLGVIPKPKFLPTTTVVDVPVENKKPPDDTPVVVKNSLESIRPIDVPTVPPVVDYDPITTPKIDDGTTIDVGSKNFIPAPTVTAAHLLKSSEPPYPDASIRQREEGVVHVRVTISARGEIGETRVEKSSGYPRLDEAALKAVRQWMFAPAMSGNQAIAGSTVIAVRFRLKN